MILGNAIGIPFSKGGGATPWVYTDDLALEYSRSGLSLSESFSGDALNATIIPGCGNITADTYLLRTMYNFAGGDSSGYLEARIYWDGASVIYPFATSDQAQDYHVIRMIVDAGGIAGFNIQEVADNRWYKTDASIGAGWHTLRITSNGSAYSWTVDGSGVAGTATTGSNDGKWFNFCTARDNLTIGAMKRTSVTASGPFLVDYVNYNGTSKWIISGQGLYEFDVIGGLHMTWVGTNQMAFNASAGTHFLNIGSTVWVKMGAVDIIVPYTSAGVPYDASAFLTPLGYVKFLDYAGVADGIIKAKVPIMLGFNETSDADSRLEIFDRANTTRMEDVTRTASDYDDTSLATRSRHSSSIMLFIGGIESHYKTGYKHRIFPINDDLDNPTKVTGFLVYNTDQL